MTTEALLLLGHGSHLNPGSSEPVHRHADALRETERFDEVRVAFWKEEPSFRDVIRTLNADRVYAVPFFMAEGYFVDEVIPRELDLPLDRVVYTEPVGTHPSMTDVIEERAVSVYEGNVSDDETALAVVGHGTERNPESAKTALEHVRILRERGEFSEVKALFMDEPPYVDDVAEQFDSDEIIVVPFFSSDGYHTQEDIPEDMGIADDGDYAVPETVESGNERKRIWYTGAVGTEPGTAEVIAELAGDARIHTNGCGTSDAGVRNDAENWFVGWLEGGDETDIHPAGQRRSWGQLSLTVRDDGYDVRHEDDIRKHTDELNAYDDLKDALHIAKFDDEGEYRPMRGETTLPTGWVFPSLDAEGLVEVVRRIYPASVENAYLERSGELDVTNWEETAGRQTGMYADVDELTGDSLRRATDALCASRCVKRREWEESGDRTVDSESEGDFPCREACSLFVSGAREFVKQERGEVEGEFSASDGEEPRRGELSNPANEYRVRYTSARRKEVKDVH